MFQILESEQVIATLYNFTIQNWFKILNYFIRTLKKMLLVSYLLLELYKKQIYETRIDLTDNGEIEVQKFFI
jgi:hypothetical protein